MNLTQVGKVWVALGSFEERTIPKAAGFWWHGMPCRDGCLACKNKVDFKVWWTPSEENAAKLAQYADGDLKTALSTLANRRKESLEASRATDAVVEIPAPEGLTYMPFQRAGIAYAMARPATLIGDEMGLGKTIQALGVVNADPSIKRVLVICPATIRLNWKVEAERWLVRPMPLTVIEDRDIPPMDGMVIVNYEKLVGKHGAGLRAAIMKAEWDLLIVDEAHRLKDNKAQRTVAILGQRKGRSRDAVEGIITRARRKLFLTGTPILNKPIEIQPLLGALAPEMFGNFWTFAKRYANAREGRWGWDLTGASNLPELQDKMRSTVLVRRLKREVMPELPAKQRQVIVIPANGAADVVARENSAFKAREEMLEELRAEAEYAHASGHEEAYKAAVAKLRDAVQAAFNEIAKLRHDTAVAKIPNVIEHLDDILEATGKVVVFAHHHDVVHALAAHFGSAAVVLTGETAQEDRMGIVGRFQDDPAVKVFIGSITAAGVGITLTAASTVVFAELDWVPANVSQAEDRCHRIGQRGSVTVQHIVLEDSLDARMAKMIVKKQEIADKALDDIAERAEPVLPIGQPRTRPKSYPVPTDAERDRAHRAMKTLAAMCDGARSIDGAGFSKFDAKVGHDLAAQARLTDGQAWLAGKLAHKYRKQLGADA